MNNEDFQVEFIFSLPSSLAKKHENHLSCDRHKYELFAKQITHESIHQPNMILQKMQLMND